MSFLARPREIAISTDDRSRAVRINEVRILAARSNGIRDTGEFRRDPPIRFVSMQVKNTQNIELLRADISDAGAAASEPGSEERGNAPGIPGASIGGRVY